MSTTDTTTNSDEQIPASDQGKVTYFLRTHPEAYQLAVERPEGYAGKLQELMAEELGEEMTPEKKYTYYNAVHAFDPEEVEAPDGYEELVEEEDDEEDEEVSVANLSAANETESPTDVLLEENIESTEDDDESQAVEITHVCSLCGYEAKARKSVQYHITNEDDSVHRGRDGGESHLIDVEGEPLQNVERTHAAFDSERVQSAFDDGFDLVWTIYQNPDARQSDIAELLDISQTTVRNRLESLGVEWGSREEDIKGLIDDLWENGDEEGGEVDEDVVERTVGNNTYKGRENGLDTTSGRPGQNIADRPVKERTFTVEVTEREVKGLLTGRDPSAVKQRLLTELLDD